MPRKEQRICKTIRFKPSDLEAIQAAAAALEEYPAGYVARVAADQARRDLRKAGK